MNSSSPSSIFAKITPPSSSSTSFASNQQQGNPPELGHIKVEELCRPICNSLQPHLFATTTIGPLNVDNGGCIHLDRNRWAIEEGGIGQKQQNWQTLELTLAIATECRKRMAQIIRFLNAKEDEDQGGIFQQELRAPIKHVFGQFVDEFGEQLQQKSDSGIKDLFDLSTFLKSQQKRMNSIFVPFEKLLSSKNQPENLLISEFWADFLQSLSFWTFQMENSKWREQLFDGFVNLVLGKYLTKIIFDDAKERNSFRKFDFIEQIWAENIFIKENLAFSIHCLNLMPKNVAEEELTPFEEIYIGRYKIEREQNRLKFTMNFLTKLVSNSLAEFVHQLSGNIVEEINKNGELAAHLKQIKDFYALKINSLRHWLPTDFNAHFEEALADEECGNKNGQKLEKIERELANRIEKMYSDSSGVNILHRMQHWSVSILLNSQLFNLLDRIFVRLYKFIFTKNCLFDAWKSAKREMAFGNIKMRIRENLHFQLAQMLQTISQMLLSQFSSTNSFYSAKLLNALEEGPEACVKSAISIVEEWCQMHKYFYEVLSISLAESLEECEKIAWELIEMHAAEIDENQKENEGEEDLDLEVLKFGDLSGRLRRVRLFIRNLEMKEKGGEKALILTDSTPTFRPLTLLKLMIPAAE